MNSNTKRSQIYINAYTFGHLQNFLNNSKIQLNDQQKS